MYTDEDVDQLRQEITVLRDRLEARDALTIAARALSREEHAEAIDQSADALTAANLLIASPFTAPEIRPKCSTVDPRQNPRLRAKGLRAPASIPMTLMVKLAIIAAGAVAIVSGAWIRLLMMGVQ